MNSEDTFLMLKYGSVAHIFSRYSALRSLGLDSDPDYYKLLSFIQSHIKSKKEQGDLIIPERVQKIIL